MDIELGSGQDSMFSVLKMADTLYIVHTTNENHPFHHLRLSGSCLGDVSVMSRSCFGRVSGLCRSCLRLGLVLLVCVGDDRVPKQI